MKIFLDTANIEEIRQAHAWGIIDGVTTNPSLIAKNGKDFIKTIYEIAELVQGPVSAETIAQDTAGMVREGKLLAQIHPHIIVKIPLTPEGIAATKQLSDEGIKTNVTLCFQANQALLAAKAGATYISPFLGRLDDVSNQGVGLIEEIVHIYENYDFKTQVLAASIRHPKHMVDVALAGADVATLPFAILKKMFSHPLTDAGNARFLKDWETVPNNNIEQAVQNWLAQRS
jgi:transaldolase